MAQALEKNYQLDFDKATQIEDEMPSSKPSAQTSQEDEDFEDVEESEMESAPSASAQAPARKKGRPRNEACRKAILKAVNSLLLHMSVQELSIEAIAKKAKVGKSTIYRWWSTKAAIVMEALISQPGIQSPLPTPRNNAEALILQLDKLIRLFDSKNGEIISQLFSEAQNDAKAHEIFSRIFLTPLIDAIEFSLTQGMKEREFRSSLDLKMTVDMLCGPIFFRLMANPASFDETFRETYPKEAVRLISA